MSECGAAGHGEDQNGSRGTSKSLKLPEILMHVENHRSQMFLDFECFRVLMLGTVFGDGRMGIYNGVLVQALLASVYTPRGESRSQVAVLNPS